MPRKYQDKDIKLLWGRSGGVCQFPDCFQHCIEPDTSVDPAAVIGEMAHIVDYSSKGILRVDPTFDRKLVNTYDNLLLLCPTHHTIVDKQPNTYTCAELRRWKSQKEQWYRSVLAQNMPRVGFDELDVVVKAIVKMPATSSDSLTLTPVRKKMERNGLTYDFEIGLGLSKANEVSAFVNHVAVMDPDFPERLKAGFIQEYNRQTAAGLSGDALFEELRMFASSARQSFSHQAAALAVLCYLFERCEVFEA